MLSLSGIAAKMKQEAIKCRNQEQETLQIIAAKTSLEFAEQAADILDSKKHSYSFKAYLVLLMRLQKLIDEGIPNCLALDAVQTGETAETIISIWRWGNEQ